MAVGLHASGLACVFARMCGGGGGGPTAPPTNSPTPPHPTPTSHARPRLPAVAIRLARRDKMDWLLHIDTDELIYPSGSRAFSLQVREGE